MVLFIAGYAATAISFFVAEGWNICRLLLSSLSIFQLLKCSNKRCLRVFLHLNLRWWKSWQVCEQADSYKPVSNFGQGSDHFQMFLVARKPFGIYEQNHSKNQFPRLHLSQNIKSHVVGFFTKIKLKSLQQLECETDSVVSHSGTFKERVHRKRNIFWISKEIALILDSYINTSIFNSWWNRNSVFWLENLYFWKTCLFRDDIGK